MAQVSYHTLSVRDMHFDIAIGIGDRDPISESIAEQTFAFPPSFHLPFALLKPGDVVIDLGAYIGTFSLAVAALGCKVLSVEASPYNAALLEASVTRNNFRQMRVVSAAISDRPGTLEFVQAGPFGVVANPVVQTPTVPVPAVTVDDLLDELGGGQVDLIKMDIEGSEVAAIRGMSRLLTRANAPPIFYESNGHTLWLFGQTPNRLLAALEEYGYTNYLVEPGQLVPVRASDLQAECNVDYLAVKQLPTDLQDWRIVPPMTLEETIDKVLSSCTHSHHHCRTYIARALARADPAILFHPKVMEALESLRTDPNTEVRAAVSWWTKIKPRDKTLSGWAMAGMRVKEEAQIQPVIATCQDEWTLRALADEVTAQSDIALRGYVVRSRMPLLGSFIAWVRRNLTSHLREPYLDPMVERQVALNRRMAEWMRRVVGFQTASTRHQTELEARVGVLEAQVEALVRRLDEGELPEER